MLLQRLVAFDGAEESDGPRFFRRRAVRWRLSLGSDGVVDTPDKGLMDLSDPSEKATRNGTEYAVPHLARSSGIAPCLGADDIQYVLGWADDSVRPERVALAHSAFVALVDQWAAVADEPAARAFARFYASGAVSSVRKPADWAPKQLVIVTVGGRRVTELPSLQRFWATAVERRKTGGDAGRRGLCLVCGQVGSLLDRLPQQIPKRLLPGAGNDASLVSTNKPIHSYDFNDTLVSVPICVDCGGGAVDGLRRLLEDPAHSMTFGGQDTRLAWWTIGERFDVAGTLGLQDPATVEGLVRRLHEGAPPVQELDPARFCSLTVAGSSARVMIRDWVDMPLARVKHNIGRWFADHAIESFRVDGSRYCSPFRLLLATGRWIEGRGQTPGSYAELGDRAAHRPDDMARSLIRAALLGTPLPTSLLGHVITRIRADGHIDGPRCALIRLLLIRSPVRTSEGPMAGLDLDDDNPYYLAGRLFATLESIQWYFVEAGRSGADDRKGLNTTFADRYLGGAIANPRIALVQGRAQAPAWLKKLRSKERYQGTARALDHQMRDLFDRIDHQGLPVPKGLHEQGLFILGYEQQRAHGARAAAERRAAGPSPNTDQS